jgi:lambda family phage minor tail protein L
MFYFTSAEDAETVITWGGQQYAALPMDASGFDMTTRGAIPQPNVTISNLFGAGNLLLDAYKGLIGATHVAPVPRRRRDAGP